MHIQTFLNFYYMKMLAIQNIGLPFFAVEGGFTVLVFYLHAVEFSQKE